jgi:hypothetical protein
MEDIGLGNIVVILTHVLKATRRAIVTIADDHLILDDQGSNLTAYAIGVLCPYLRHAEIALV